MSTGEEQDRAERHLWGRYRELQHYRERKLVDPESEDDKRHDQFLRELIDEGSYDEANRYINDMIEFCERIEDLVAAELYRGYGKRVEELQEIG